MINISWRKITLPIKITVAVTGTVITAIIGFTAVSLYDQQNYFQQKSKKKAEFLLNTISLSLYH